MHDGPSRVLWLRLVRLSAASSGRGAAVHVSELVYIKLSDPARIQSRPHQRVACGPHAPRRRQYSRRARARGRRGRRSAAAPGPARPRAARALRHRLSRAQQARVHLITAGHHFCTYRCTRAQCIWSLSCTVVHGTLTRVYLDAHQRHVLCSALSAGAHGRAHHAQTRRPMRRPERQLAAEETGPHHPTVPRTRRHLDQRLIMF